MAFLGPTIMVICNAHVTAMLPTQTRAHKLDEMSTTTAKACQTDANSRIWTVNPFHRHACERNGIKHSHISSWSSLSSFVDLSNVVCIRVRCTMLPLTGSTISVYCERSCLTEGFQVFFFFISRSLFVSQPSMAIFIFIFLTNIELIRPENTEAATRQTTVLCLCAHTWAGTAFVCVSLFSSWTYVRRWWTLECIHRYKYLPSCTAPTSIPFDLNDQFENIVITWSAVHVYLDYYLCLS